MISAFQLLNMGGGSAAPIWDANTLYVPFEDTTLYVYRGVFSMKTIFIDKDSDAKRISADWTDWLNGSDIASVVWEIENSSSQIVLSNKSNTVKVATAYVNANDYNLELHVKCTITTNDSIPETESRSFLIRTVRTF